MLIALVVCITLSVYFCYKIAYQCSNSFRIMANRALTQTKYPAKQKKVQPETTYADSNVALPTERNLLDSDRQSSEAKLSLDLDVSAGPIVEANDLYSKVDPNFGNLLEKHGSPRDIDLDYEYDEDPDWEKEARNRKPKGIFLELAEIERGKCTIQQHL